MTQCARSLEWYNWNDDWFDYSDKNFKWLDDTYVSIMTSQGDTNMCAQIITPSQTVWRAENCSSLYVPSRGTCTSSFMIIWWMVFCKIICPVIYSPFPIGIKVAHFCTILEPMVFHNPWFGMFWLHKQVDDSNASFPVQMEGIAIFWLWMAHGDEGVSDREHWLSVEEHTSYFRLYCWGHYIFLCLEEG